MSDAVPAFDLFSIATYVEEHFLLDAVQVYTVNHNALDPSDGSYPSESHDLKYSGKAMIAPPGSASDGSEYYMLGIPRDIMTIYRGDEVLCTAAYSDPKLVGMTFEVIDELEGTYTAYKQITMARRTEPGE